MDLPWQGEIAFGCVKVLEIVRLDTVADELKFVGCEEVLIVSEIFFMGQIIEDDVFVDFDVGNDLFAFIDKELFSGGQVPKRFVFLVFENVNNFMQYFFSI